MNFEFHYYVTYLIAVWTGRPMAEAATIAHASLFRRR